MTEKIIQKALLQNFSSHTYKFANAYFFNNESDLLTFLPSGFCYEIEIKISRSDFKADFKKEKHSVHRSNETNSGFFLRKVRDNYSFNPSWEICRHFPELVSSEERLYTKRIRGNVREEDSLQDVCEVYFSAHISSEVRFEQTKNLMLPNKFFYAVPEGLIKKEEVPEYAGLLYIHENLTVTKVKDGKFIHKDLLKPDRLFNKIYYAYERELWRKLK